MTVMLVLLVVGVGIHYLRFDPAQIDTPLKTLSLLTKCTGASLGRAYYEPTTHCSPLTAHSSNIAYPEMQAIDRMDFVYAKF